MDEAVQEVQEPVVEQKRVHGLRIPAYLQSHSKRELAEWSARNAK